MSSQAVSQNGNDRSPNYNKEKRISCVTVLYQIHPRTVVVTCQH